jgi:hypothetical protein
MHRDRGGCNGGGFLGKHRDRGGCHGAVAPSCGCCGTTAYAGAGCVGGGAVVVPPPPVVMPKVDPKPIKPKTGD